MKEKFIPFIFITILIIVIVLSIYFSKNSRIKRKLKKAKYRDIAKFKNNEIAKITGKVELIDEPLISPLSKRKCALYYIHVEQQISTGKTTKWKTIIEEKVSTKFVINHKNSYAFINDKNIAFYIVKDKEYSSGTFNDATKTLENYLKQNNIDSVGFLGFNKTIRYYEGIFDIGETIAVLGKGIWKNATSLDLPKKYGKVLEITSTNDLEIYMSDDPSTTNKTVDNNSKQREINSTRYRK